MIPLFFLTLLPGTYPWRYRRLGKPNHLEDLQMVCLERFHCLDHQLLDHRHSHMGRRTSWCFLLHFRLGGNPLRKNIILIINGGNDLHSLHGNNYGFLRGDDGCSLRWNSVLVFLLDMPLPLRLPLRRFHHIVLYPCLRLHFELHLRFLHR